METQPDKNPKLTKEQEAMLGTMATVQSQAFFFGLTGVAFVGIFI